jgi:nanoRNase/pAp phosphatase (c-di-AMP/oligoRNAs hydrolase)
LLTLGKRFKSNKERIQCFLKLFDKGDQVLILFWADPDALASAFALKKILQGRVSKVTLSAVNEIKRLNNLVMVEILKIPLTPFQREFLKVYQKIILVDSQPTHHEAFKEIQFTAVIDHHPVTEGWSAEYVDLRPNYGATSTILYEYLKTLRLKPNVFLSTALIYGIKTDTDNFKKSAQLQDVLAFQRLFKRMNKHLLNKIESSDLRRSELRYFKTALHNLKYQGNRAFTYLGKVSSPDVLVLVADFLNKVYETAWVFVAGEYKKNLIIIVRCDGYRKNAGKLVSKLFKNIGLAGGHREKARAEIPFANLSLEPEEFSTASLLKLFKKYFPSKGAKEKPSVDVPPI